MASLVVPDQTQYLQVRRTRQTKEVREYNTKCQHSLIHYIDIVLHSSMWQSLSGVNLPN